MEIFLKVYSFDKHNRISIIRIKELLSNDFQGLRWQKEGNK